MPMRVMGVGPRETPAFLAYCATHRFDHDESFLDEHSLSLFAAGADEKTVILLDGEDAVRGAASLMLAPAYREAGKARFRIFHAESARESDYRAMLEALLPLEKEFRASYLFLSDRAPVTEGIVAALGFTIERRSWLLGRGLDAPVDTRLPPGLRLVSCDPADRGSVDAWCHIINDAFHGMAGHSTMTPEDYSRSLDPAAVLPGGDLLLHEGSLAIGLVAVRKDVDEPDAGQVFLGPIAVIPARQKQGLGRALLRAGLAAARERGFRSCVLTVNAENEKALSLYLDEGFARKAVYTCWVLSPRE